MASSSENSWCIEVLQGGIEVHRFGVNGVLRGLVRTIDGSVQQAVIFPGDSKAGGTVIYPYQIAPNETRISAGDRLRIKSYLQRIGIDGAFVNSPSGDMPVPNQTSIESVIEALAADMP